VAVHAIATLVGLHAKARVLNLRLTVGPSGLYGGPLLCVTWRQSAVSGEAVRALWRAAAVAGAVAALDAQ